MQSFQVVVGNIGHVYDGNNYMQARAIYSAYVKQSKAGYGRAASEPVTLFHKGEIRSEYFPPNTAHDADQHDEPPEPDDDATDARSTRHYPSLEGDDNA